MKRMLVAACIGTTLALSACGPIGPVSPGGVLGQTQVDERAMGLAVTAAHAADLAAEAAVDAGWLKGAKAAQVADNLEAAHGAIAAAKAALLLGQDGTCSEKLAIAKSLVDQALGLIPKAKD